MSITLAKSMMITAGAFSTARSGGSCVHLPGPLCLSPYGYKGVGSMHSGREPVGFVTSDPQARTVLAVEVRIHQGSALK